MKVERGWISHRRFLLTLTAIPHDRIKAPAKFLAFHGCIWLPGPLTKRAGVRPGILVSQDFQYDHRERRSRTTLSVGAYLAVGGNSL
jgi:hypothetical protein